MPLLALVILSACASQQASRVAALAAGRPAADLERCLGAPTHKDTVAGVEENVASTTVLEWDFSEKSSASTTVLDAVLPPLQTLTNAVDSMLFPSADLQCRAVAGVQAGWVVSLTLSGDTSGISGPDAGCQPLTRGCLFNWTH